MIEDGYAGTITLKSGSTLENTHLQFTTATPVSPTRPSLVIEDGVTFSDGETKLNLGDAFTANMMNITGIGILCNKLVASGSITLAQGSAAQPVTIMSNYLEAGGDLTIEGAIVKDQDSPDAYIKAGSITVSNGIETAGTVTATGGAIDVGAGDITAGGAVSAAGHIQVIGNLAAGGDVTAGGAVSAAGHIQVIGNLAAGGDVTAGTNSGASNRDIIVDGNLNAAGFAVSASSVWMKGDAHTLTAASVTATDGTIVMEGAINLTGDMTAAGNISLNGGTCFDLVSGGNLSMMADSTLTVKGDMTVTGNVAGNASGILAVNGDMTVTGDASGMSSLTVLGKLDVAGTVGAGTGSIHELVKATTLTFSSADSRIDIISGTVDEIGTDAGTLTIGTVNASGGVSTIDAQNGAIVIQDLAGTIGAVSAGSFQVASSAATAAITGPVTLNDKADVIDFTKGGSISGTVNFGGGADFLKGGSVSSDLTAGSTTAAADLTVDGATFTGMTSITGTGTFADSKLTLEDVKGNNLSVTKFESVTVNNSVVGSVSHATTLNFLRDGRSAGLLANVASITVDGSLSLGDTATISNVGNIAYSNTNIALGQYQLATGNTMGTTITIDALNGGGVMDYNTAYLFKGTDEFAFVRNTGASITLQVYEAFGAYELLADQFAGYNFAISADIVTGLGLAGYTVRFLDGTSDITTRFTETAFHCEQKFYLLNDDAIQSFTVEVTFIDELGAIKVVTKGMTVIDRSAPVIKNVFSVKQTADAYTFVLTAGTYTDNFDGANVIQTYAIYDGATLIDTNITADFAAYAGKELTVVETATDKAGNKTTQSKVIEIADVTAPDHLVISSITQKNGYTFDVIVSGTDNVGIDHFYLEVTKNGVKVATSVIYSDGKFVVTVNEEITSLEKLNFEVTAADKAGNKKTIAKNFTVLDVTAPVIDTAFDAVQNADYTFTVTQGDYIDNSGAVAVLTYAVYNGSTLVMQGNLAALQKFDFAKYVGQELTVVETATDAAGNQTTQKQVIEILDRTAPDRLAVTSVKQKNGYTFELFLSGSDNVGIDQFNLEVIDTKGNLIAATLEPVNGNVGKFIVKVDSEATTLGDLLFTLTATDKAGNVSLPVTEYVIVNDVTAPVVLGVFDAKHDQALNSGIYTLDYTPGAYDDNSGSVSAPTYAIYLGATLIGTDITADFAAYAGKELTVVETVTDAAGNKTSQKATVKINDVTSPDVPTIEIVKQDNRYRFNFSISGADNLEVAKYELTITDQAGNVVVTPKLQPAAGNRALFETTVDLSQYAAQDLILTVKTWDKAGNENITVLDLPVRDTTPPEITATSIVQKKAERPNESGFNFNVFVEASDNVTDPADLEYTVRVYSNLGANAAAMYTFEKAVYDNGKVTFELDPVLYDTKYWYTIEAKDAEGNSTVTDFVAFTAATKMADPVNPQKDIIPDASGVGSATLTGDLTFKKDSDTYKLTHSYAGLTTLVIKGIDPGEKAKVTIINSNGKKTTYKVSYGKNEIRTNILTNAGDSFLTIRSTDKKVNVADYEIQLDTKYFPATKHNSADSAFDLLSSVKADSKVAGSNTDWVGYGDARDYYKLTSECAGEYNIKVAATGGKVTVKFLNEAGRTVKTMSVGAGQEKTISTLYYSKIKIADRNISYVMVESASKGKATKHNTDYTLTVTENVFNKGDNGQVVDLGKIGNSEVNKTDWLGFGDALDTFAFQADANGVFSLDITKLDGSVDLNLDKIKVKLYDSNGKSVAMSKLGGSLEQGFSFASKKELIADSDYVLSLSISNEKKNKADYNLGVAIN